MKKTKTKKTSLTLSPPLRSLLDRTAREPLTDRQQAVYDSIQLKWLTSGLTPTVREIGDTHGISSPNGVMCHLKALEKKGWIVRDVHNSRTIVTVDAARVLDEQLTALSGTAG